MGDDEAMQREVQRDLGKLTEAVEGLRRDIAAIGADTRQGLSNMGRRVDEVVDQIGELRADGAARGAQIASIQAKIEEEIEPAAAKVRAWEQRGIGALAAVGMVAGSLGLIAGYAWDGIKAKLGI